MIGESVTDPGGGGGILLRIKKRSPAVSLPCYQSAGAAGMDLRAFLAEDRELPPLGRCRIPTGLMLEIPEGYEAQVRPRSGLADRQGITVLNSPGTIDSDYRGELEIILINFGSEPVIIKNGDRIAQLVLAPVIRAVVREVPALRETRRGSGGFGSTGL